MKASPSLLTPDILDIVDLSRETDVSFTGTAGVSAALVPTRVTGGIYDVVSDIDAFIAVAEDPSGVTTTTGYPVYAGNVITLYVPTGYKIGAISSSASGTLMIHRARTF